MRSRSLILFALVLLSLAAGPALRGATLLTSEVPVLFGFPSAATPLFLNGEFGYAIYVPPGAQRLIVRFVAVTPSQVMEVYVRHGADPGVNGVGGVFYDYKLVDIGESVQEIQIHPQSSPPIRSGMYFIGFRLVFSETLVDGLIMATVVGGSVTPTRTVATSNFDRDLDGWTRTGDANGELLWVPTGGSPGGYLRSEEPGGSAQDTLVAPGKFLGNLRALPGARLEFDYKQIAGAPANFAVELRIRGSGTTYSWVGATPLTPPEELPFPLPNTYPPLIDPPPNPPIGPPANRWWRYVAPLQVQLWTRVSGDKMFSQVLANVDRIELVVDLSVFADSQALDNFTLVAEGEGPPQIVLAGNTSFAAGADGWMRNYPSSEQAGSTTGDAGSTFRWVGFEGNPNGYVRLNDAGGSNRDYLLVPARFLGDYRQIPNPQIEFDYYHSSVRGPSQPVEVLLAGADTVFGWTGTVPTTRMWTHYAAPLAESNWRRVSGTATLAAVLANVRRIEISTDQADGAEWNGVDNFWVLTASTTPAPAALSANPLALSFTAVVRGANPVAQSIGVTSMGGGSALSFTATTNASWLKTSAANGNTPRALNVWPDIAGLGEGTHTARVTVTPLGGGLAPRTVGVSVRVTARPEGFPRISTGGVINAANFRRQLSPGALGSVYGENFGPSTPVVAAFVPNTTTLPTSVQGVRVLVQETYGALIAEAPLLYVSRTQINFQLPYECFGRAEVLIVVDINGALSDPQAVQVISSAPGVFTWGAGRAVAVNQDGSVNTAENGAQRGSVLTVYLTGQGVITPPLASGAAAGSRPLVRCPLPSRAWVGGSTAQLLFVGMAPGLVGVLQVNLTVPWDAPSGETQLLFNVDGWTSNFAGVTVR